MSAMPPTAPPLLLKGFEVELYTGRPDGTVVGCSAEAAAALSGFVTEPDCRNLEYITPPDASYRQQLELLLEPRRRLRPWLAERGLTLLPGSTLSTGDSHRFDRSDPSNPYHGYIEATYGTRVVTASVHINLGLTDMDALFAACRLMRCEGALLLALSASSPFLDGHSTGAHSQRWLQFPLTPQQVPLFESHGHYIAWMEQQLQLGTMQNVRHLWTSVRPNGDDRPHDLNRLEIRICDLITDPPAAWMLRPWRSWPMPTTAPPPAPASKPRCGTGATARRSPPAAGSPAPWTRWLPWPGSAAWRPGWPPCPPCWSRATRRCNGWLPTAAAPPWRR